LSVAENQTIVESGSAAMVVAAHRGGVEVVEGWGDAWRKLCQQVVDDQPFYRPEWIAAHIKAFTPGAKVVLLTVTCDDRLCLVLPLLEDRAVLGGVPVRRLRAPANSHSCRFDAVCCGGAERDLAVRALWNYLGKLAAWDLLELRDVPEGGTLSTLATMAEADGFRTAQVPMLPNPYVPIPSDAAGLEKMPVNKKLRSQLRGIRREFSENDQLELRRICTADPSVLQQFYELESAGWKGAEGSAISSTPETRQFYDEVAKSAAHYGYLCIYSLQLNGELLASHIGSSYKGRYFSPKVAYNENFKQLAPGHLIVEEIIRDCAARDVHEYDITGANEQWKTKWASQTRGRSMYYIFRGVAGGLAHSLHFRLRPWVKKMTKRRTEESKANPEAGPK
jgi:CelD/BcsL family acetyltransferase involved in cellulose biosynthesis